MCPVTSEKCQPIVEIPNGPLEEMSAIVESK